MFRERLFTFMFPSVNMSNYVSYDFHSKQQLFMFSAVPGLKKNCVFHILEQKTIVHVSCDFQSKQQLFVSCVSQISNYLCFLLFP
jgi:hypothetical protein